MDGSRAIDIVLRGGPAHGLQMAIMRHQLHRPLTAMGWPNAYHWHLDEDVDDEGRPVFRCDVPDLHQYNFVITPQVLDTCAMDMVAEVEKQVRQRLRNPGYKVHLHWEGVLPNHEIERVDPRGTDLSRFAMLKCGGVVIRDRYPRQEGPAA